MSKTLLVLSLCALVTSEEQLKWSPYVPQSQSASSRKINDVSTETSIWSACSETEDKKENSSGLCQSLKMLSRAVKQFLDTPNIFHLADGVDVVKVEMDDNSVDTSRNLVDENDSVIGKVGRFISSHELRIKLKNILPLNDDISKIFTSGETQEVTGRGGGGGGKDKGGVGSLLAMAMMMKAMMGAVGLGGVGLLAMKALMVSAMAFMLAAIVGIKKLASKDDDGGVHHVQVVPTYHHSGGEHGHYRRKRYLDESVRHPYRAYRQFIA